MLPTYKNGKKLLIKKKWFFCTLNKGDIVVFYHPQNKKILIKRILEKNNNEFILIGDNISKSTDSRTFGSVCKKNIIGKVIY